MGLDPVPRAQHPDQLTLGHATKPVLVRGGIGGDRQLGAAGRTSSAIPGPNAAAGLHDWPGKVRAVWRESVTGREAVARSGREAARGRAERLRGPGGDAVAGHRAEEAGDHGVRGHAEALDDGDRGGVALVDFR